MHTYNFPYKEYLVIKNCIWYTPVSFLMANLKISKQEDCENFNKIDFVKNIFYCDRAENIQNCIFLRNIY